MPEPLIPLNTPMGLRSLEAQETDVASYLETLPEYVRIGIRERADEINSLQDLHRVADELQRGKKKE
ncbi:MAG TPA: hypothetical protein VHO94_03810 [Oscillospiraceae bacterium]|nr:hypothetical protein [Oscillospiraceae bacterium]